MCDQTSSKVAIFCDLQALEGTARAEHLKRSKRLFATFSDSIRWLDSGFELVLEKDPEGLAEFARWAHSESLCCPFLDFEIRLRPATRDALIRVSEPAEAAGFLRSELHALGVV
jgi:hypothetical protein